MKLLTSGDEDVAIPSRSTIHVYRASRRYRTDFASKNRRHSFSVCSGFVGCSGPCWFQGGIPNMWKWLERNANKRREEENKVYSTSPECIYKLLVTKDQLVKCDTLVWADNICRDLQYRRCVYVM